MQDQPRLGGGARAARSQAVGRLQVQGPQGLLLAARQAVEQRAEPDQARRVQCQGHRLHPDAQGGLFTLGSPRFSIRVCLPVLAII